MHSEDGDAVLWVQAETLALQTILVGLCRSLAKISPEHKAAVSEAFYHADDTLQAGSLKLAGEGAETHIRTTLHIIEQLRAGVEGHSEPKDAV